MSEYNGRSRDSEDSDKVKLLSVCGQREGKRNLKFGRQNNGVGCCLNQGVESVRSLQKTKKNGLEELAQKEYEGV